MKHIRVFLSENFHFSVVKFSVYLNRHVSVMSDIAKTFYLMIKLNCIQVFVAFMSIRTEIN